jgi:RNA-directed DNA polymerase
LGKWGPFKIFNLVLKKHSNLYEKICTYENIHSSYLSCRRSKRYNDYVLNFTWNLEEELEEIRKDLVQKTYKHGSYNSFILNDSKKREIKAAPFRDRIVHRAVYNVIEPIFDKTFIYDTYACRNGKGTHKAIKRLQKFLRVEETKQKPMYCLQCDISKYFQSIDHKILFSLIEKHIADKEVLWLIKEILDSEPEGIPIGNLTSQVFANLYLNEIDQYVKHNLQQKYFLRYMDDFLILSFSKKELHEIREKLHLFLKNDLKLKFHPKKANVYPVKKGVDFLGFLVFKDYRLLRKTTVCRFIKRTRKNKNKLSSERFDSSLQSWLAYAIFGNSWKLRKSLEKKLKIIFGLYFFYLISDLFF